MSASTRAATLKTLLVAANRFKKCGLSPCETIVALTIAEMGRPVTTVEVFQALQDHPAGALHVATSMRNLYKKGVLDRSKFRHDTGHPGWKYWVHERAERILLPETAQATTTTTTEPTK